MAKPPKKGARQKYKKKQKSPEVPQSSLEPAKRTASDHTHSVSIENAGQLAEQARASYALDYLNDILEKTRDENNFKHSELKAYIRRLPGMIQMNGFGQAMAFYYAKSSSSGKADRNTKENDNYTNNAYGIVYTIVENWLCKSDQVYANTPSGAHRLLSAIVHNDQQAYRAAQAETHALMRWVKKFAEALILKSDANEE